MRMFVCLFEWKSKDGKYHMCWLPDGHEGEHRCCFLCSESIVEVEGAKGNATVRPTR